MRNEISVEITPNSLFVFGRRRTHLSTGGATNQSADVRFEYPCAARPSPRLMAAISRHWSKAGAINAPSLACRSPDRDGAFTLPGLLRSELGAVVIFCATSPARLGYPDPRSQFRGFRKGACSIQCWQPENSKPANPVRADSSAAPGLELGRRWPFSSARRCRSSSETKP